MYFNPRTPCGVRRVHWRATRQGPVFQSTHPVWGATRCDNAAGRPFLFQSTHPVWGATRLAAVRAWDKLFQSTHPVWGATSPNWPGSRSSENFNPRTPCGVRRSVPPYHRKSVIFQSTHPVWGATFYSVKGDKRCMRFQSTHPVWGATTAAAEQLPVLLISIHAPRVGCDKVMRRLSDIDTNFNPRTPCGVRLVLQLCQCLIKYFNPRTPCGVRRRPGPS